MTQQRAVGSQASPQKATRTKVRALAAMGIFLATVIASLLVTKPYQAILDVTIVNAINLGKVKGKDVGSPVFAYFSSRPGKYNPAHLSQSHEIPIANDLHTRTALHRIELVSSKPMRGIRLDPGTTAGSLKIKGLKLTTPEGVIEYSPHEIQKMLMAGNSIENVQISGEFVAFNAIDGDPHFDIDAPKLLTIPSVSARIWSHIKVWLNISLPILAAFLLLYKNRLLRLDRANLTHENRGDSVRIRAFSGFAIDLISVAALAVASQQLIAMHAGIRLEPLMNIFARDGVGNSVPKEVKWMKEVVTRQGFGTYTLAGDLGEGMENNEIYQRASEYLYPAHVDQNSDLIFIRSALKDAYEARPCKMLDMQQDIFLYDCKK